MGEKEKPWVMMMMMGTGVRELSVSEYGRGNEEEDRGRDRDGEEFVERSRKKRWVRNGDGRRCQAEKCRSDLSDAKAYHRRHRVCEYHSKAQEVIVAEITQRFCQQCSRFHELSEFDDAKRSCRRRLAGHNERRRKNATESHVESSSRKETVASLEDIAYEHQAEGGAEPVNYQNLHRLMH